MSKGTVGIPAPIFANVPGSFANFTVSTRIPEIGRLAARRFSETPRIERQIHSLTDEIVNNNKIDPAHFSNSTLYTREMINKYTNEKWHRLPFFEIESLFYSGINSICQYDKFRIDAFEIQKNSSNANAIRKLIKKQRNLAENRNYSNINTTITKLIFNTIFGNEFDYSSKRILDGHNRGYRRTSSRILIDETKFLVDQLAPLAPKIAYVIDNTGTELYSDLELIAFMINQRLVDSITIFPKKKPMYVSDATEHDIEKFICILASHGGIGSNLSDGLTAALDDGRLRIETHEDWNEPRHFNNLTDTLTSSLLEHDVIVMKGDLNYRRFLEDRTWALDTEPKLASSSVPFESLCLRSLKSECLVGVSPSLAAAANNARRDWMTDGYFGVAQILGARENGIQNF